MTLFCKWFGHKFLHTSHIVNNKNFKYIVCERINCRCDGYIVDFISENPERLSYDEFIAWNKEEYNGKLTHCDHCNKDNIGWVNYKNCVILDNKNTCSNCDIKLNHHQKETKMKHDCTHRPLKFVKNVYYNLVLECRLYQCTDCHLQLLVDEKHKEEEKTARMIEDHMKLWCIGCHTFSISDIANCFCDKCLLKKLREDNIKNQHEVNDLKNILERNAESFPMKGMVTLAEFKEYKKITERGLDGRLFSLNAKINDNDRYIAKLELALSKMTAIINTNISIENLLKDLKTTLEKFNER